MSYKNHSYIFEIFRQNCNNKRRSILEWISTGKGSGAKFSLNRRTILYVIYHDPQADSILFTCDNRQQLLSLLCISLTLIDSQQEPRRHKMDQDQESGMEMSTTATLSLMFALGLKFLTGFCVPKHLTSNRSQWLWKHSLSEAAFCGLLCVWCPMVLNDFWQVMDEDGANRMTVFTRSSQLIVCFCCIHYLVDIVDVLRSSSAYETTE